MLLFGGLLGGILALDHKPVGVLEGLLKLGIIMFSLLIAVIGVFAFVLSAIAMSVIRTAWNTGRLVALVEGFEQRWNTVPASSPEPR
jgi:hypothetical protein